jgi:hypothetical protein
MPNFALKTVGGFLVFTFPDPCIGICSIRLEALFVVGCIHGKFWETKMARVVIRGCQVFIARHAPITAGDRFVCKILTPGLVGGQEKSGLADRALASVLGNG